MVQAGTIESLAREEVRDNGWSLGGGLASLWEQAKIPFENDNCPVWKVGCNVKELEG